MRVWLWVLCACLSPTWVNGQTVKITQQVCGVARCRVEAVGAGVVIGRADHPDGSSTYYILTVYHLTGRRWDVKVFQALTEDPRLTVTTPIGAFPSKVASYNGQLRLMLLSIAVPANCPRIPVMPLAEQLPQAGDSVSIRGFNWMGAGEARERSVVVRSVGPEVVELNNSVEQGESGGPIVKGGCVIGLVEGCDVKSKIGWGPSIVAIRDFLHLPAVGTGGERSRSPGVVPARPAVPVQPGGPVPVPPPPVPEDPPTEAAGVGRGADATATHGETGGDAPRFAPPIHNPAEVIPAPEPDPISHPGSDPVPAEPIPRIAEQESRTPSRSSVVGAVATGARVGLDVWSALAGAGIVVGTGGLGGLALLAWRGVKLGRAIAGSRHQVPAAVNPAPSPSPQVAPHAAPQSPPVANPVHARRPFVIPSAPGPQWDGQLPPHDVRIVSVPNDYRKASVDWAIEQFARTEPQSHAAAKFRSLINQHLSASGHARPEELHE